MLATRIVYALKDKAGFHARSETWASNSACSSCNYIGIPIRERKATETNSSHCTVQTSFWWFHPQRPRMPS